MAYFGPLWVNHILRGKTKEEVIKMDSTQQENTQTAAQETTKTSRLDKLKTLFTAIKSRVVAFFTTTAAWLKAQFNARPWVKYAVIVVAIVALAGGLGYWRDRQLTSQIDTLKTESQAKTEQIKVVEAERDDIRAQYNELKKQFIAIQAVNDTNIKEAGKHAYQKANSIPDTDVLHNFNLLINGARKRNAGR